MFKNLTNFVKGENVSEKEEVVQEQKVKLEIKEEDEQLRKLKEKIGNPEINKRSSFSADRNDIYQNEIFTNKSDQVKIVKPKSYENSEMIGEAIKKGKVIILDLSKVENVLATRILDFVSGVCFSHNIIPEVVEAKIFMIDPAHKKEV